MGEGGPPAGLQFPRCTTAPPEGPHKPINHGSVPVHFYRIEFRRLDAEGLSSHWRQWYPWLAKPVKPAPHVSPGPAMGPNVSEQWPYSRTYDSVLAAPDNYRTLYEDGHVRLIEVSIRPGETTPIHGHPYASVLAFDAVAADPRQVIDTKLDPDDPRNGQGAGHGAAPQRVEYDGADVHDDGAAGAAFDPESERCAGALLSHRIQAGGRGGAG